VPHRPRYHLGINCGFAINRFPEPEVWMPLVRERFGLDCVQFVADLLNPLWPRAILQDQVRTILDLGDRLGVRVQSTFTSAFTRINHLMHPDPSQRGMWLDWFKTFATLSANLGAECMGSHFGIMSVRDWEDPHRRRQRVDDAVAAWQEIARHGREAGLRYLIFEPMSCPRENGWTIEESQELLDRVNQKAAIPMHICLDLGHAPHPDQRDPYEWLERLGPVSPVIHLQQTEAGHSRHWPFTPTYNQAGIIRAERVLSILDRCGLEDVWLYLEISHRERWPDDTQVADDLAASAAWWREALRKHEGPQ